MSLIKENTFKIRESKLLHRWYLVKQTAVVLESFFSLGFKNYATFSSIVRYHAKDVKQYDIMQFWHFRKINPEFLELMENVLEIVKRNSNE